VVKPVARPGVIASQGFENQEWPAELNGPAQCPVEAVIPPGPPKGGHPIEDVFTLCTHPTLVRWSDACIRDFVSVDIGRG